MSPGPDQTDTTALPQLGRYQLLEQLGAGGMGQVYLAHDQRLDRRVAVKVLPPGSVNDPGAVARFQREAKALAQLSHPGIIQAYDSEQADGRHFLVMEFVEGQSLAALLKEKGRLAPAVAADYAHQAALALQHAHEKGLVHRDVKPSNLLLAAGGRVKLLDLGLARFLQDQVADPARTREGAGMGTPDYAAPEQFRDAHVADTRADIYALGCTLFHLLTGQVPFPGSSLSEKYEAHAHQAPPPVEELCPDVPGGLALVVQKMLAKRPADRFQSAAEVAEALAPFVAGSSASFQSIRKTSEWEGGRLTVKDWRVRRRRLLPWAVAALSLAVAVVMGGMMFGPRWFGAERERGEELPVVENKGQDRTTNGGGKKEEKAPLATRPETPADDPNVLTVSQKEEEGGKYRSIGAALSDVKPWQTIRVLDAAVYRESVALNDAARHKGVTLEAVVGATLETTTPTDLIEIDRVPHVTIRGFRLRARGVVADRRGAILVAVTGACPGLLLERLEADSNRKGSYNGVVFLGPIPIAPGQPPAVVRQCALSRAYIGIGIGGSSDDRTTPRPASGIVIRDNRIADVSRVGVQLSGSLRDVQVVGNRIWGANEAGLLLAHLFPETTRILLANNTVFNSGVCCGLQDDGVKGRDVQLRNNLLLGPQGPDVIFVDGTGVPGNPLRPRDGKSLLKAWRIDYNWREGRPPTGTDPFSQGWVPRAEKDVLREQIEGVNRDPKDRDNFLRPAKDSPLATNGAGETDPSLPSYVGALPPEGVEPWDWDRTWKARGVPGRHQLLTVSKKDGGTYRSINAALKDAKPWATIRVLDAETYAEPIALVDPDRHEGICLEAPKQAVIRLTGSRQGAVFIKGVPHARVRGFRFREAPGTRENAPALTVLSHSPGVTLEDLDVDMASPTPGIFLQAESTPGEDPVVVQRCSVRAGNECVFVSGPVKTGLRLVPTGGVVVRENRLRGGKWAILLQGGLRHVQVTGNRLWEGKHAGLQLQDLREDSGSILLANNTVFASGAGLRIYDNPPHPEHKRGQVEFCSNVLADALDEDAAIVLASRDGENNQPGDGAALLRLWRFHHNWRDLSGQQSRWALPMAARDQKLDGVRWLSREPSSPDFLRPPADSPLTTAGAGDRDASLPRYVGAVPPRGVRPWDWDRTWRGHMMKASGEVKKEQEKP